jgi:nucleoside-diphosphate-sugar epimerase
VLLASSSAVYGFGDGSPMSETHSCAPVNTYGKSKLDMEAMARNVAADTNMEICCLRIGNIAGADALLLNASKATPETPLIIDRFPDGAGPLRSYIGPTQAGDVLAQLACHQGTLPHVLNLAGTAPIHMEELAIAAALPWRYATAP